MFFIILAAREGKNAISHAAERSDGARLPAIQEDQAGQHPSGGHRRQQVFVPPTARRTTLQLRTHLRNFSLAGNPKLTLGLIWTIILHFQVSRKPPTSARRSVNALERQALRNVLNIPSLLTACSANHSLVSGGGR